MIDMPSAETCALHDFLKQASPESVLIREDNVYIPSEFEVPKQLNVHDFASECTQISLPMRQLSEFVDAVAQAERLIVKQEPEGIEDMLGVLLLYQEVLRPAKRRNLMIWCSY